jgi:hypothetical protein
MRWMWRVERNQRGFLSGNAPAVRGRLPGVLQAQHPARELGDVGRGVHHQRGVGIVRSPISLRRFKLRRYEMMQPGGKWLIGVPI